MILLADEERELAIGVSNIIGNNVLLEDKLLKAQLKRVYDWGDEDCPHSQERHLRPVKRQCPQCWQALLEEAE